MRNIRTAHTMSTIDPKQQDKPVGSKDSSASRVARLEASLVAEGGAVKSRVRLSKEANIALQKLAVHYGTEQEAIRQALIQHAQAVQTEE